MTAAEYDPAEDSRRSYEAAVEAKRKRGDTHWPVRASDSMLPIIAQLDDAEDDRARARILLAVPDKVLEWPDTYRQIEAVCRKAAFDLGLAFIACRRSSWSAVRGPDGQVAAFEPVRIAFARYAAGGEHG